jgi:hypothetical protein
MPQQAPYLGISVTLPTANTNYSLRTLLKAIDVDVDSARELQLQSDSSNGSAVIAVGDINLSASRRAYKLTTGSARYYRSISDNLPIGGMYLRTDTNGSVVNVEMIYA